MSRPETFGMALVEQQYVPSPRKCECQCPWYKDTSRHVWILVYRSVCVCAQWRDVIVAVTSVGQQQIMHCLWRHQLQRWQRAS